MKKDDLGQFFTKKEYWIYDDIISLLKENKFENIIDPFAGNCDLLKSEIFNKYKKIGFDIDKTYINNKEILFNNSLISIPVFNNSLIVTNPPYFSRVSASIKKNKYILDYLNKTNYKDIYFIAIQNALKSTRFSIFIIPETFLFSKNNIFKNQIVSVNIIEENMFLDTEIPVVSIIFDSQKQTKDFKIYKNGKFLFFNSYLEKIVNDNLSSSLNIPIVFNEKSGQIFLKAIDNSKDEKIYFDYMNETHKNINIKVSSRFITAIKIPDYLDHKKIVELSNLKLNEIRNKTNDLFLSPFMGNNNKNKRRRRLDYVTARKIIWSSIDDIKQQRNI